ncbi:MAG: glycosyltransferase family 39 protein [Bacteroidales bacterium]|nr:glycosyltransferase family 39 protein [Bacteroidales bacterium]
MAQAHNTVPAPALARAVSPDSLLTRSGGWEPEPFLELGVIVRNCWQPLFPAILAVTLTALNAVKPAVIDDTAYLQFAAQLAAHPLDPYGGELFWYSEPQNTNQILLPPVLPYWLALGIGLFGERLVALKFWLLPFALMLAYSLNALLRRFAPRVAVPVLTATLLGPAVLPMFNVMLDLPAIALGLTAVAVFARACDRDSLRLTVASGVLAALAIQTKYTMLVLPGVFFVYAVLCGRWYRVIAALLSCAVVFLGWEKWLETQYGTGHFVYHLVEQQRMTDYQMQMQNLPRTFVNRVFFTIASKWQLFSPMLGYLGWLGIGVGFLAARALRLPRGIIWVGGILAFGGFTAVCLTPYSQGVLLTDPVTGIVKLDLAKVVFVTLGSASGLLVLGCVVALMVRPTSGRSVWPCRGCRVDPLSVFLMLWLLIELLGYFALTPFPAGRRVLSLALAATLLVARLLDYRVMMQPAFSAAVWRACASSIAAGVVLFAVDTWDAYPEKAGAEWAAQQIGDPGSATVWYNGHWGFQYYCEHAGMKPALPGHSPMRAGDWLVLPLLPDAFGFYRPYHGGAIIRFRAEEEPSPVGEWVWEDRLAGQTIPNLYGGTVPVAGRDHPRLRLGLFRIPRDCVPRP